MDNIVTKRSRWGEFVAGVKIALPIIVGFVPVAITFAIMAGDAGLNALQSILMSMMVFAGASQIMAVGMWANGVGVLAIVVATFILNLRHLIMSTCVVKQFEETSYAKKFMLAFGITDETFAIFTMDRNNHSIYYFAGLVVVGYLSWVGGTIIGVCANSILPAIIADSFAIALYAMFIALLVPNIKNSLRLGIVVLITALLNWALLSILPSGWALIVATLVGAFIGVWVVED